MREAGITERSGRKVACDRSPNGDTGNKQDGRGAVLAMRRILVGLTMTGSLVLPACHWVGQPEGRPEEIFVPLRVENGRLSLEVALPRRLRTFFLFDSGSGDLTLIDRSLSRELRLHHEVVDDAQRPYLNIETELGFLEAGSVGKEDVMVYVDDFDHREHLADLPVSGVFGAGFFRGECLFFDLANGVYSSNHPRGLLPGQVPLALRWGPQATLSLTVRVNGQEVKALVDTGSAHTYVAPGFAVRAGLRIQDPSDAQSGPQGRRSVFLPELGLEELTQSDLWVYAADRDRDVPHADLRLGMDVLQNYGLIFDLSPEPYLVLDPSRGIGASASNDPEFEIVPE